MAENVDLEDQSCDFEQRRVGGRGFETGWHFRANCCTELEGCNIIERMGVDYGRESELTSFIS